MIYEGTQCQCGHYVSKPHPDLPEHYLNCCMKCPNTWTIPMWNRGRAACVACRNFAHWCEACRLLWCETCSGAYPRTPSPWKLTKDEAEQIRGRVYETCPSYFLGPHDLWCGQCAEWIGTRPCTCPDIERKIGRDPVRQYLPDGLTGIVRRGWCERI